MGPTFIIQNIIREEIRNIGDLSRATETACRGLGFIFHLEALTIQNLEFTTDCSLFLWCTAANCTIVRATALQGSLAPQHHILSRQKVISQEQPEGHSEDTDTLLCSNITDRWQRIYYCQILTAAYVVLINMAIDKAAI